jgi:hypothetical protein
MPGEREGEIKVALNATLLARLAEALGSDSGCVVLHILPGAVKPIRVTSGQGEGAIMPITLDSLAQHFPTALRARSRSRG